MYERSQVVSGVYYTGLHAVAIEEEEEEGTQQARGAAVVGPFVVFVPLLQFLPIFLLPPLSLPPSSFPLLTRPAVYYNSALSPLSGKHPLLLLLHPKS